jgi:hypothetical protein
MWNYRVQDTEGIVPCPIFWRVGGEKIKITSLARFWYKYIKVLNINSISCSNSSFLECSPAQATRVRFPAETSLFRGAKVENGYDLGQVSSHDLRFHSLRPFEISHKTNSHLWYNFIYPALVSETTTKKVQNCWEKGWQDRPSGA